MSNKSIYQDLKFFDKNGYEIPLVIASNIVIKIYNKFGSEKNATIINGVYNNKKDINGNFIIDNVKIIDTGRSFSFNKIELENSIIEVYVDGIMLNNVIFNKINILETIPFNVAYTSSNADLKEYVKYGIKDIELEFVISKSELDDLFHTNYEMPFPSLVFNANIDMEKVSTGLHSVETLYFGIEKNGNLIKPFDSQYNIVFLTDVKDDDVQFFVVDTNTDEIYKKHRIIVDLSDNNTFDDDYFDTTSKEFNNTINEEEIITNAPQINVCFSSDEEGVHEQKIYIMLVDRTNENNIIKIGEFNVTVETEGEDERFRALFANFGIPDPIMYPSLFKECDIKEEKTNWEIVNRKSKELFLTYDEIFPYVGTYKALINAVKYLGYNDVYFREWYKDIKKGIKYSKRINLNENFNDNKPYITYDTILENRMNQKKLNKLSLVYKLNEESGENDEYNIPILRNVYNYSIDEVFLKLNSLKEWLEKNIIGLNCRIIEITGEGVVYEKTSFKTYGTIMQNLEHEEYIKFTPYLKNTTVELRDGSANIEISVINDSEKSYITFEDFEESFSEYNNNHFGTLKYPFPNSIYVKAFAECDNSIITNNLLNGEILLHNNKLLLFRDEQDNLKNVIFKKSPIISLSNAKIKLNTPIYNNTYEEWWNNIDFLIEQNDNNIDFVDIENESKNTYDDIFLSPNENNSLLTYVYKEDVDTLFFVFRNYKLAIRNNKGIEYKNIFENNTDYILEIKRGNIYIDKNETLSFNYEENEQSIKVLKTYEGVQYIEKNKNIDSSIGIIEPFYNLKVNDCGTYKIMTYAINEYGNIFCKKVINDCKVIPYNDSLYCYKETNTIINDKDFFDKNLYSNVTEEIAFDNRPIFEWIPRIYDIKISEKNNIITYPYLSYFNIQPNKNDHLYLTNISDRFTFKEKNAKDNVVFESINKKYNGYKVADKVNVVVYSKKYLNGIYEYEGIIESIENNLVFEISFQEETINFIDYCYNNNYEFYIFPIAEYKVDKIEPNIKNNYTDIFINDIKNLSDNDYIYKIGDSVKLTIIMKYNEEDSFLGGASFKVIDYVKEEGMIRLNGVFNFEIDENNPNLILNISKSTQKYVNYDTKVENVQKLNAENIYVVKDAIFNEVNNKEKKAIKHLFLEKYVNKDKIIIDSYKNRLFDFIDDTFSLIHLNFDKCNAFENWNQAINNTQVLYKYDGNNPITINNNESIFYKFKLNQLKKIKWNIYKREENDKSKRELLFSVENEVLALNLKEKGIYDIEIYAFDRSGNLIHKDYQAIIKVK